MSEQNDKTNNQKSNSAPSEQGSRSKIELSAPWGGHQYGRYINKEEKEFLVQRTRVHETYIREEARNKRIGLLLAFILILSAALIMVFAPDGKQTLSYWIGAALLIFAAGASGFARLWGKTKNISFGADQDRRDIS